MIRRDKQATMDKQFLDPRSYVAPDGREVLYGEDWKARKWDLWQRCGGRCEEKVLVEVSDSHLQHPFVSGTAYIRCSSEAVDPHHLIRRSELRDDRLANLQALCRFHHDLLDERKPKWTRREREAVKCD